MNTNKNNTNTEVTANRIWWGTATATRKNDGTARDYVAVQYTAGKSGYKTEADIYKSEKIERCPNRSYAVVRAVTRALACGLPIDAKTANEYPFALTCVREDEKVRAERAEQSAINKAERARDLAKHAKEEANTTIANICVID